ncbi:hypothetical protein QJS66_10425 [Kocuria rhizophila]|nr:hypothetical protein QJS66_10425 [Kocuria rhizophila]
MSHASCEQSFLPQRPRRGLRSLPGRRNDDLHDPYAFGELLDKLYDGALDTRDRGTSSSGRRGRPAHGPGAHPFSKVWLVEPVPGAGQPLGHRAWTGGRPRGYGPEGGDPAQFEDLGQGDRQGTSTPSPRSATAEFGERLTRLHVPQGAGRQHPQDHRQPGQAVVHGGAGPAPRTRPSTGPSSTWTTDPHGPRTRAARRCRCRPWRR